MRKFLQLVVGLLGLGLVVLAVVDFQPWRQLLPYFQGCMTELMSPPISKERQEQLDQFADAFRHRREAKWQMAKEVIAGRLSLADAMERFHVLDQGLPPDLVLTPEAFEMSEDEWDGHGVIFYVRLFLKIPRGEENPVVSRLEKELQELLADRKTRPAAPVEPRTEERSR
jgi:hypothetical protein